MRVDQRDIDCEFAVAVDELLGAIQGVDQPVTLPLPALLERRQSLFFGDDRYVRCQLPESGDDAVMRCQVGLCQRRFVAFFLNVEICRVDFEDRLASFGGQGNDRFDQFFEVHGDIRTFRRGAQYKAVTIDPKTALENCATLMLDMDGTILDLAYDNYMWLTHIPERWGEKNGMSLSEARKHLFARYGAAQGELHWYCLDHWSERLDLDVMQLHRDNHELIKFLPGAKEFLAAIHGMEIEVLLVTNSHGDTLELKDQVTGLGEYFDGIHSSHSYGFAKERQEFWRALQTEVGFDPQTTMFVDDTIRVLKSAAEFGVEHLLAITRPDTSEPPREGGEFKAVEGVANLLL